MGRERGADEVPTPPLEDEPTVLDDREIGAEGDAEPLRHSSLNPDAPAFEPALLHASLPALSRLRSAPSTSSPLASSSMVLDIEMGEVEETPKAKELPSSRAVELEEGEEEGAVEEEQVGKDRVAKVKEELEEGEATDGSSELTELPDDA